MDPGAVDDPPERVKAAREHRVPLSSRAMDILKACEVHRAGTFVLPGEQIDSPVSEMALEMLMRRIGVKDAIP